MIIKETTLRELIPDKNKRLTDGKVIAEKSVFLGVGDSADNWYEIPEEEAVEILREKEANYDPEQ